MHTGMLWFDNSTTKFEVKLQTAVDYYYQKYGRKPDLCLIHPRTYGEPGKKSGFEVCGLMVRFYRPILPGHIWIGIEDKEDE